MRQITFFTILFLVHCAVFSQVKDEFNLDLYFNRELSDSQRIEINRNIEAYSKQIAVNPIDATLYVNRGVQSGYLGLFAEAIKDYNKALEIDSAIAEAYYNRGLAKSRFAYTKSGCSDIKKSAVLGLTQAKELYLKKCGLYIDELGGIR